MAQSAAAYASFPSETSLDEIRGNLAQLAPRIGIPAFNEIWNGHDWHNPGAHTTFSSAPLIAAFGNKISTPGEQIWVDNDGLLFYRSTAGDSELKRHFETLRQQFIDAGYEVDIYIQRTATDCYARPRCPNHLIMHAMLEHGCYLTLTRLAPSFENGIHITRIDSLGLHDIATRTIAAWHRRDAQIQRILDNYENIIPDMMKQTYRDFMAQYIAQGLTPPAYRINRIDQKRPEIEILLIDDKLDVMRRRYPFDIIEDLWGDKPIKSQNFSQQFERDLNRHWMATERATKNGGLVATGIANQLIQKYDLQLRAKYDGCIVPLKGTVPTGDGQYIKYKMRNNKGRIEADIELHRGGSTVSESLIFCLGTGVFFIRDQQLPEAALGNLKDKPLRRLVESGLIPESLIIRSISLQRDGVRGEVRGQNVLLKPFEDVKNALRGGQEYEMI